MVVFAAAVLAFASIAEVPVVRTARVPDAGIQPQVVVSPRGFRHLLYYKGEPGGGDLYYASCSKDTTEFGAGIRVNSIPNAACAMGTMRGGQIAFSPDGRVHIAWNGSHDAAEALKEKSAGAKRHGGEPMLYTRSNAERDAFEPERDLMSRTRDLDGGGSIAIAPDGRVAVVWHASTPETESRGEAGRQVFLATSTDRGVTFSTESAFAWSDSPLGACGCCGLKTSFAADGALLVLFRSAARKSQRDMHLLRTADLGKTTTDTLLGRWSTPSCPMSSASASGTLIAWESENNVYWASTGAEIKPASPAKSDGARKHPSVAANAKGQVLLAWVEGATFGSEGTLRWQVFEAAGIPVDGASGGGETVAAWSLVAAFAEADGSFTIVY